MFAILIPFSYMWIPNQYTNIKDHEYHVDISSQAWRGRICGARRALITILSSGLPGSSNKRLSPWKTCCKAFNLNFSLTPNHSCWQLWSFRWCVEMSTRVIVGSVRTVTGLTNEGAGLTTDQGNRPMATGQDTDHCPYLLLRGLKHHRWQYFPSSNGTKHNPYIKVWVSGLLSLSDLLAILTSDSCLWHLKRL